MHSIKISFYMGNPFTGRYHSPNRRAFHILRTSSETVIFDTIKSYIMPSVKN